MLGLIYFLKIEKLSKCVYFSIFKKYMSPSLQIEFYQSAGNIKRTVKTDLPKRYIIRFNF